MKKSILFLIFLRPLLDIFSPLEFQLSDRLPALNVNALIGGFVFVFFGWFLLKQLAKTGRIPLFYPIAAFSSISLISVFYSIDTASALREFIRLASIFFLYFSAYLLIQNEKDWQLLIKTVLASYLIPGLVALGQFFSGAGLPDDFGGFNRIYGTFAHPNSLALYSFLILALLISLLLQKQKTKKPALLRLGPGDNLTKTKDTRRQSKLFFFTLFTALILFFTYSRSAAAALVFFALILGIFKYRKVLVAAAFAFLLAYIFSDVFRDRFWELVTLDPYGSVVWRVRLWKDMIPVALWQPWFGYGINSFERLVEYYRGFRFGSLEAHNDYLKIFVENGLVGLTAYLWLIIALIYNLFKKTQNETDNPLALGLIALAVSIFLAGLFDNILRTTALQWTFWVLMAGWLKTSAFDSQ